MGSFRKKNPVRTCTQVYKDYKSFKEDLVKDFNNRCGYTDCPDFWFGGSRTFHIDHFKPHSKYPELKTSYSNLVYSCSYVNIAKSDIDNQHFLDPCDNDYNEHFRRNSNGSIIPISVEARIMYNELKLYLIRYQVIWMLDEIKGKLDKLIEINDNNPSQEASDMIVDLTKYFIQYLDYLQAQQ